MATREELEQLARAYVAAITEELVQRSEDVDFRQGTYLLGAMAAELGALVQQRCWELARSSGSNWEIASSEAETLINAAWKCMAEISARSDDEDRRARRRGGPLDPTD